MKIEVSDGEIVDKYSILCLKLDLIPDKNKRKEVQCEKDLLHDYATLRIGHWPMYYRLLLHVNKQIWDKTNQVKAFHPPENPEAFIQLSQDIFSLNDQRFRLKRIFNTGSEVKEQKSYADKTLHIFIPDHDFLETKLDELIYMVMIYDKIVIVLDKENQQVAGTVHHWLPPFCVSFLHETEPSLLNQPGQQPPVARDDAGALSIIHYFTSTQA